MQGALIVLDRDGVLNKHIVSADCKTDSPMTIDQIEMFPWVPEQLKILNKKLNYGLVIATNQPAASKGKISFADLLSIHAEIQRRAQSEGGVILDSFICFHQSKDSCSCRKPKTALLEDAFKAFYTYAKKNSWMVGDRATDIIAGYNFGLKTALLGPSVKDDMDVLYKLNITPTYHGKDLRDFVKNVSSL